METKEFTTVHLNNLKIDDLFSLNKSTIEYANPVKENIGEMPKAILIRLETDHNAMGLQMNKALKNALTPQLTLMNADRKDRFAEIKRNVTTALKGRDAEKKAAANNLKVFLDPYWDTDKKPLNTQTGLYSEMLGKFSDSEMLQAYAAAIGISAMMEGLAGSNNDFNEIYQTRLMQEAAAEGPAATSLRAAATKSYVQFCTSIEQAVNFTPSETLITLFNQLDELRKTYARLVRTEEEKPEEIPAPVQ
jgi:hypothetical protein